MEVRELCLTIALFLTVLFLRGVAASPLWSAVLVPAWPAVSPRRSVPNFCCLLWLVSWWGMLIGFLWGGLASGSFDPWFWIKMMPLNWSTSYATQIWSPRFFAESLPGSTVAFSFKQ
jgi:hypothetical protein